jgi:flagellar motor switch protein FliM
MASSEGEQVLNPDVVTTLLEGMEEGKPKIMAAPNAPSREKISPYDFKRPERVGKDQMRALQSMHEGFGRNFGAALSALLRSIVDVRLASVDQLTYSEFVFGLETPTCFNLLRADPLEGNLILDIDPKILYPIIDRLLGGGKESTKMDKRALTEIELRLVARITKLFLHEMKHAWESIVSLDLSVERVESNPQLVQIVPPNEVVILVSFEVTIGETSAMMNLCIPFNSIERISPKLQANSWFTYGKSESTPETISLLSHQLDRTELELIVTLAETQISTKDLIGLRVGDIIATEKDIRQPLEVSVGGVAKYTASPGAFKGNKAIQVERCLEEEG